MRRVSWDLNPYAGKTGRIRIVDDSSGPWGHINADDFRIIPEATGPPTAAVRVPDLTGLTVEQSAEVLANSRLRIGRVARHTSDRRPDTVIEQDPPPETEARPGSRVALIVAEAGPPPIDDHPRDGTPPPPGKIRKWLWFVPGLLVVWGAFRLIKRPKKTGKTPLRATIRMRAVRDGGTQAIQPDIPRLSGPEIRLRPVRDRGRQDAAGKGSGPD
ncbi:MAG: PASTA domain-containing protein [Geobacteraceae bacterium]|nr:PASTA domain-containing protein [Geobacteraceae bacterium]